MESNKSCSVPSLSRYLICLVLISFTGCTYATPNSQQLNQEINKTKKHIQQAKQDKSHYQEQLKNVEEHSSQLQKQLDQTQVQLIKKNTALKKNQHDALQNRKQLNQQRHLITHQIRAIYLLGQQPYLKLLLNQDDSEKIRRFLYYYQVINHQQLKTINALNHTVTKLTEQQQTITHETDELKKLQQRQKIKQQSLHTLKKQRQQLISQINQQINTEQKKLNSLLVDQTNLTHTVRRLNQQATNNTTHFSTQQHQLIWPVHGKIVSGFHSIIGNSQLRTDGIVIQAGANTPVHAVASGKVIFANWLVGYGLIMIISHGDGYMTLYGRNTSLYYHTGDWVNKDTVIATVGDSGGYPTTGLYFAIRHNAQPLNPLNWLH